MIVVVTGCYQYLHQGHLLLLEKAAKLGDVIVFLNTDEGVWELKGYLGESFEARKKNLLKTGLVKRVLAFKTDPTTLLYLIKPDFWVAGNDHSREEMEKKAGNNVREIILFPRTPDIDSRQIHQEREKEKEKENSRTESQDRNKSSGPNSSSFR